MRYRPASFLQEDVVLKQTYVLIKTLTTVLQAALSPESFVLPYKAFTLRAQDKSLHNYITTPLPLPTGLCP